MKNWKKIFVSSLCLAAFVIGGCAVPPKPATNTSMMQVHKEKYSRFVEKYKSLNLDGLILEDFEYQQIKTPENENTMDYWFFDNRRKNLLGISYLKINVLDKSTSVYDESFYVLYVGDFTNFYYEAGDKPEDKMAFESHHYNLNGEPYSISVCVYKPTERSCQWILEKGIAFVKKLDGFYANGSKITSSNETEQVKELFDIAAKNYKKIESLIEKQ